MKNILLCSGFIGLLLVIIMIIITMVKLSNNSEEDLLEVETIIKNHKFEPDIIRVPSGKKIRLIVHNHDDTVEEFESTDLHREKIVMPGDSIRIIIAPLSKGKYHFFGDFHQDTAQGSLIAN